MMGKGSPKRIVVDLKKSEKSTKKRCRGSYDQTFPLSVKAFHKPAHKNPVNTLGA